MRSAFPICLVLCGLNLQVGAAPGDFLPVPPVQVIPEPYHQASFQRDGVEMLRYHYGPSLNRPFLYPVVGPSGRSLTRMGHPHDPETHSHHNSIWISHNDVDGVSFWDDRGKGRIVHQRVEELRDGANSAAIFSLNHWVSGTNHAVLLMEKRAVIYRPLEQGESWIEIALELEPRKSEVRFGKTPFGLVGVRMAKSIGVNDGHGEIRNSEGAFNEKEVFWKPARWVDYSGLIAPNRVEGITLMDHPANLNHPTAFHVRNDGWMGTSLTLEKEMIVTREKPLVLRYGFYVHAGQPTVERLQKRWEEFAATERTPWPTKK